MIKSFFVTLLQQKALCCKKTTETVANKQNFSLHGREYSYTNSR